MKLTLKKPIQILPVWGIFLVVVIVNYFYFDIEHSVIAFWVTLIVAGLLYFYNVRVFGRRYWEKIWGEE